MATPAGGREAPDSIKQRVDEIYSTLGRCSFLSPTPPHTNPPFFPFSFLLEHQQLGPSWGWLGATAISALIPRPDPRAGSPGPERTPAGSGDAAAASSQRPAGRSGGVGGVGTRDLRTLRSGWQFPGWGCPPTRGAQGRKGVAGLGL